jgi:hypothetical protein
MSRIAGSRIEKSVHHRAVLGFNVATLAKAALAFN